MIQTRWSFPIEEKDLYVYAMWDTSIYALCGIPGQHFHWFATEAAAKVSHCVTISAMHAVWFYAVKGKACTSSR